MWYPLFITFQRNAVHKRATNFHTSKLLISGVFAFSCEKSTQKAPLFKARTELVYIFDQLISEI